MATECVSTVADFERRKFCGETLESLVDVALEYGKLMMLIDGFYKEARKWIGQPQIYLVAESSGWTTKMKVSIEEEK